MKTLNMRMICYYSVFIAFYCLIIDHVVAKYVVVVTGASSGIGKSIAEAFSKDDDFRVYATMRDPSKWTSTDISAANLVVEALDVTSDDSVSQFFTKIHEKEGRIDILVNNAGLAISGCLEMLHIEEAKSVFDVNLWGCVRMMQAALPLMRKQRSGYIINISSTSGIRGIPCLEYYTGSKFALEGITDSLRYSLAPYNISVTNVNAGPVKTKFAEVAKTGTRPVVEANDGQYLENLANRMSAGLIRRLESGQTSESLAQLVMNLVHIKRRASAITDVPFNVGGDIAAQSLLEDVRRHPTGWGGLFTTMIAGMPPLPEDLPQRDEL